MNIPKWLEDNPKLTKPNEAKVKYWFRTPVGIESMLKAELETKTKELQVFQSHRNVFAVFDQNGPDEKELAKLVAQMRTADDVFRFVGCCKGIERAKASIEILESYFEQIIIPRLKKENHHKYIRVTLSFVGKRNFNRFSVEEKLNAIIVKNCQLIPLSNKEKTPRKNNELRLRCHLENSYAFFGLGLKDIPLHRRTWRNIQYPGQLRPPIAATMARLLAPKKNDLVIDPFCGSGTILIESAFIHADSRHIGFDLSEEAIGIAKKSALLAKKNIDFSTNNSLLQFPAYKNYFLISNPPWDEKHHIENKAIFVENLINLIANSTQAVLILPSEFIEIIQEKLKLTIAQITTTRVRGKIAAIINIIGS